MDYKKKKKMNYEETKLGYEGYLKQSLSLNFYVLVFHGTMHC
jgi:hypothetical protein